jgi:hypothetical protein
LAGLIDINRREPKAAVVRPAEARTARSSSAITVVSAIRDAKGGAGSGARCGASSEATTSTSVEPDAEDTVEMTALPGDAL